MNRNINKESKRKKKENHIQFKSFQNMCNTAKYFEKINEHNLTNY